MKTFVITRDHIYSPEYDSKSAVDVLPDCFERKDGLVDFRLYDDDRVLCFEGFAVDDGEGLEDAWQWGAWFAGTTMLDTKVGDLWEVTIG